MSITKKFSEMVSDFLMGKKDPDNKKPSKKLFENLVIILIIGIIALLAGSYFLKSGPTTGGTSQGVSGGNGSDTAGLIETAKTIDEEKEIEQKLGEILSQIQGAGRVSVLLSYESGKEVVPVEEVKKSESATVEKDKDGGTRSINQYNYENTVIFSEQSGKKEPVVLKENMPKARGAVVVAEGGGSAEIREKLAKAVQAILDIPMYRVQVFERKKGG